MQGDGDSSAQRFRHGGLFQRPAFALVQFPAVAQAEVDGRVPGDGGDPAGKFRAVAQQPEPAIAADEGLLRRLLRQRGVAEPAPGHGEHAPFMALDQFAVALGIAAAHRRHRCRILARMVHAFV